MLNTVEFLTGVWHYSAVEAGLAIAPGPLMVLPFARFVAPAAGRLLGGPGRVAVIGCLVNAAAQGLWLCQIQAHPAYLTHLLPAQLLGGAGVGLTIPSLLGAGSASLPPARFGTGSGVLNMARQIGTVLGVAGLVAILSRLSPADPLAAYRHGLVLIIAFFAAAGVVSAALLTARPVPEKAGPLEGIAQPGGCPAGGCPAGDRWGARQDLEAERAGLITGRSGSCLSQGQGEQGVRGGPPPGYAGFPASSGEEPRWQGRLWQGRLWQGRLWQGRLWQGSQAEREQTIDALKAAFVQGRLTMEEFEARIGQTFTSRTYAELAAVTADIPDGLPAVRPPRRGRVPG